MRLMRQKPADGGSGRCAGKAGSNQQNGSDQRLGTRNLGTRNLGARNLGVAAQRNLNAVECQAQRQSEATVMLSFSLRTGFGQQVNAALRRN